MSQETTRPYKVKVITSSKQPIIKRLFACSKWHAVELVYTEFMKVQSNRTMYKPQRIYN